jgi:uncharacterized protein (DUF433 family)
VRRTVEQQMSRAARAGYVAARDELRRRGCLAGGYGLASTDGGDYPLCARHLVGAAAGVLKLFPVSNEFSEATPLLTRREAAELSGTTLGAVNKAIEQRVLRVRRRKGRTLLAPEDVGALALLSQTRVSLPVAMKRRVVAWSHGVSEVGAELRLDGVLLVRAGPGIEQAVQRARRYLQLRERLVEVDPDVCGGEPVIRESRVPIRGLARQIELGETLEVLREDYHFLPEEAFELAPLWAKANPRQGRPQRPWIEGERTPASRLRLPAQAA